MRFSPIYLIVILLLPAGAAADSEVGTLSTTATVKFPADATVAITPIALYTDFPRDGAHITFSSPHVMVRVYEQTLMTAGSPDAAYYRLETARNDRSYVLTNVSLVGHAVDFGIVAYDGALRSSAMPLGAEISVTATDVSRMGQTQVEYDGRPPADAEGWARRFDSVHLRTSIEAPVNVTGGGSLRMHGVQMTIHADQNTTSLYTGDEPAGDAAVHELTHRRVVFEFTEGHLTLDSTRKIDIAATAATARWSTAIALVPSVPSDATLLSLDKGALRGSFAAATIDGRAGMLVQIAREDAPPSTLSSIVAEGGARTLIPLLILGAALGGASVFAWTRRTTPSASLAECVEQADAALGEDRFDDGLRWLTRARRLAPASARLATDQGFAYEALGRVDDALAAYDDAIARSSDGEAAFLAARLAAAFSDRVEVAENYLEIALERTPELLEDILSWRDFQKLLARPRVARALRQARNTTK